MQIGGIQKNSFIDFPSKISCVIFTLGCNFDCPYCHNPKLVKPPSNFPVLNTKEIFSFLAARKEFYDGVVISGGEPTLQKDLCDFCSQLKKMGYPVKIDTNGGNPHVIKRLITAHLVDYIAMDIKTSPDRYSSVITRLIDPDAIRSSIRIIADSGIDYEFRTTCVKSIVDKDDIRIIAQLIKGNGPFILQKVQHNGIEVLHPEFFENHDWYYSDPAIENFRAIASDYVKQCIVRGE